MHPRVFGSPLHTISFSILRGSDLVQEVFPSPAPRTGLRRSPIYPKRKQRTVPTPFERGAGTVRVDRTGWGRSASSACPICADFPTWVGGAQAVTEVIRTMVWG